MLAPPRPLPPSAAAAAAGPVPAAPAPLAVSPAQPRTPPTFSALLGASALGQLEAIGAGLLATALVVAPIVISGEDGPATGVVASVFGTLAASAAYFGVAAWRVSSRMQEVAKRRGYRGSILWPVLAVLLGGPLAAWLVALPFGESCPECAGYGALFSFFAAELLLPPALFRPSLRPWPPLPTVVRGSALRIGFPVLQW